LGHSATLDQSGVTPGEQTGLGRCAIADFLGQSAVIVDPQLSVVTRSSPLRAVGAASWRARSSPGCFPAPARSGISGRIEIRGHHDRAGDLFDASGWNTARHLVRPRWV